MSTSKRALTRDLTEGIGRLRWSDTKSQIKRHVPGVVWANIEWFYAFKKVFWIEERFEVAPDMSFTAIIEPDTGEDTMLVALFVPKEEWPKLAALCRELGKDIETPPSDEDEEELTWSASGVSLTVYESVDFGGYALHIEAPLPATQKKKKVRNPLDDKENYDFGD